MSRPRRGQRIIQALGTDRACGADPASGMRGLPLLWVEDARHRFRRTALASAIAAGWAGASRSPFRWWWPQWPCVNAGRKALTCEDAIRDTLLTALTQGHWVVAPVWRGGRSLLPPCWRRWCPQWLRAQWPCISASRNVSTCENATRGTPLTALTQGHWAPSRGFRGGPVIIGLISNVVVCAARGGDAIATPWS